MGLVNSSTIIEFDMDSARFKVGTRLCYQDNPIWAVEIRGCVVEIMEVAPNGYFVKFLNPSEQLRTLLYSRGYSCDSLYLATGLAHNDIFIEPLSQPPASSSRSTSIIVDALWSW